MELARLIEHLSDPRVYPGPTTKVDVHQTHISVVFVTDTIRLQDQEADRSRFLDYSTLEKRRHWCEEEVRLNRRLAPSHLSGCCADRAGRPDRSGRGRWLGRRVGSQDAQAPRRGEPGPGGRAR